MAEEHPYELRSGGEILAALDKASSRVEAAAVELGKLGQQFGEGYVDKESGELKLGIGLQFKTQLDEEKAQLWTSAIAEERRPPPEDIREAMAQKAIQTKHPELWLEFHNTKTKIDGLRAWISNQKAVISALQSVRKGEAP